MKFISEIYSTCTVAQRESICFPVCLIGHRLWFQNLPNYRTVYHCYLKSLVSLGAKISLKMCSCPVFFYFVRTVYNFICLCHLGNFSAVLLSGNFKIFHSLNVREKNFYQLRMWRLCDIILETFCVYILEIFRVNFLETFCVYILEIFCAHFLGTFCKRTLETFV